MNLVQSSLKIVEYPHPALRHKSVPLTAIDRKVHLYAGAMLDLMYEHRGLGLAANQVALPYRLLVMNYAGDPEQKEQEGVFINPVILEKKGGTVEGEEGCLSFPKLFQKVRRHRTVRVQGYNLKGELLEMELSELPARIWQHEVDHLDGVLFIDKMGTIGRLASRGALREFERAHRKAQAKGELPPDEELARQMRELEKEA